jgi:hypothetical protein
LHKSGGLFPSGSSANAVTNSSLLAPLVNISPAQYAKHLKLSKENQMFLLMQKHLIYRKHTTIIDNNSNDINIVPNAENKSKS